MKRQTGTRTIMTFLAVIALMSAAFVTEAGEPGTVTMPPVVKVGAKGKVNVTDGTGGYKAGKGSGFNQIDAATSGAGEFDFTAKKKPSTTIDDSGITVNYPSPQEGEEEKNVTANCTVAALVGKMVGKTWLDFKRAIISVKAVGTPKALGNIEGAILSISIPTFPKTPYNWATSANIISDEETFFSTDKFIGSVAITTAKFGGLTFSAKGSFSGNEGWGVDFK